LVPFRWLVASVAAATLWIGGCSSNPRLTLTEPQLVERERLEDDKATEEMTQLIERLVKRVASKNEPVTDFLALSGGGDYGAFGSGFLVGWGTIKDPKFERPDFDAVTGVSTGALIAPFAFLDDEQAISQVDDFYRNPRKDWVRSRGWFFFLPIFPSFMEIPGLDRDVRGSMDEAFVHRIAQRASEGRCLMVAATNLDLKEQRAWDLGTEAMRASTKQDFARINDMVFASSAIPAVFPPVEIDGFLYADGGVTANVLLRLDPSLPRGFIQTWKRTYPDRKLPKIRFWIIFNNQMREPPTTVQPRWPKIATPSLSTAIRSATVAEIRWLSSQADYVNAAYGTDIEVRVVAIPDDWRAPVPGDFQKETMVSLSDLGRKLGADPTCWKVWTKPPVGPSKDQK
jgi:hypothetical protein